MGSKPALVGAVLINDGHVGATLIQVETHGTVLRVDAVIVIGEAGGGTAKL